MAKPLQWSLTPIVKFGSHIPVLVKVLSITTGPCLEMGMGFNSSLVMHWLCAAADRELVSYENDPSYFHWPLRAGKFEGGKHSVHQVFDWDDASIDDRKLWDVAFLDHKPSERRIVDIRRLADRTNYLIIHDSEGRNNSFFHYRDVFPLFKWQWNYDKFIPKTTILSNYVDLTGFSVP